MKAIRKTIRSNLIKFGEILIPLNYSINLFFVAGRNTSSQFTFSLRAMRLQNNLFRATIARILFAFLFCRNLVYSGKKFKITNLTADLV